MIILSRIINIINDFRQKNKIRKQNYKERFSPGDLVEYPKHNLTKTQVYQTGSNLNLAIELATVNKFHNIYSNSEISVASIGTCFAEEFSTFIKKQNGELGNYLYFEDNVFNSSANWGRVYTIQNLLQIVNYSLSENIPVFIEESSKGFLDPLREYSVGHYNSFEIAYNSILDHRKASKDIFLKTQILVITLGQNEAWYDNKLNIIWGAAPALEIQEKFRTRFKPVESDYMQNLLDLNTIIDTLISANKNLKIIITVSPVAAAATFLNSDIVTQSFGGKCILRAVVHEVIKNRVGQVFYFPSFELVLCDNPNSFLPDNRHVSRNKVKEIFDILSKTLKTNTTNLV